MAAALPLPVHVHQPDGVKVRPLSDEEGCRACPLPAGHPVHKVPPAPGQAEHRRWAGEEVDVEND